jgi:hypothetical protein
VGVSGSEGHSGPLGGPAPALITRPLFFWRPWRRVPPSGLLAFPSPCLALSPSVNWPSARTRREPRNPGPVTARASRVAPPCIVRAALPPPFATDFSSHALFCRISCSPTPFSLRPIAADQVAPLKSIDVGGGLACLMCRRSRLFRLLTGLASDLACRRYCRSTHTSNSSPVDTAHGSWIRCSAVGASPSWYKTSFKRAILQGCARSKLCAKQAAYSDRAQASSAQSPARTCGMCNKHTRNTANQHARTYRQSACGNISPISMREHIANQHARTYRQSACENISPISMQTCLYRINDG